MSPPWLIAVSTAVVALVVTRAATQALWPFLRSDEWPYIVPVHTPTATDVYSKNLQEGRWLNYAWWILVGQHNTPVWATVTYIGAYALLAAGLWGVLRPAAHRLPWATDVTLGLAAFASAIWVQLLYWPGTLTSSILVGAASIWALPWAARHPRRLAIWTVASTVLTTLSYPPVGAVLFLAAVVVLRRRPWHAVLLLSGGYLLALALGVGIIYAINGLAFGHIGVEIAAWRHPNPLRSMSDLVLNATRYLHQLRGLAQALWLPALLGLVAAVVGWRDRTVRPWLLRLMLGVAVVAGPEAAQTLVTGVVTPVRGELWVWMALLAPSAWLLAGTPRRTRQVGSACIAALAIIGVLTWRSDIGAHQTTREQYTAIVTSATARRPDGIRPPVVLYQDPAVRVTGYGKTVAGTLRMMVRQAQGGVVPRWCRPQECSHIASAHQSVVNLGAVIGLVVPPPPAWL